MNKGQSNAIKRAYEPLVEQHVLPPINFPMVPRLFSNEGRRAIITKELKESGAKLLMLLGDIPIREFLSYFHSCKSLAEITNNKRNYGKMLTISIEGFSVQVLPLVHPRQAGRLGSSISDWASTHEAWMNRCISGGNSYL